MTTQGARYVVPGYGTIDIRPEGGKPVLTAPEPIPDWISVAENKVSVTTDAGRFSYTRSKVETFKYEPGWELWFFTLDSPFYGKSFGELAGLATTATGSTPTRTNLGYMVSRILDQHDVAARRRRLGDLRDDPDGLPRHDDRSTCGPAARLSSRPATSIRSAPCALPPAGSSTSSAGVDGLIWTIILSRAFGPGPMTGAIAIAITDAGTFGKTFSEALENIDEKQVEGIQSTGANSLQRARFGVIPQITPILLSQILYYLESNTRSATVIGAIVGGGIGLLLTQAIITQKDWEEVAYYMVLIILMVMAMDSLSGWLRRKLIKGE